MISKLAPDSFQNGPRFFSKLIPILFKTGPDSFQNWPRIFSKLAPILFKTDPAKQCRVTPGTHAWPAEGRSERALPSRRTGPKGRRVLPRRGLRIAARGLQTGSRGGPDLPPGRSGSGARGVPYRLSGRSRFAAGKVGKRCPGVSQLPPRMPGILPRRDMALMLRGIALLGSGITDPRAVGPAYLAKLDCRVMIIAIFYYTDWRHYGDQKKTRGFHTVFCHFENKVR